jgi:putative membrane protein
MAPEKLQSIFTWLTTCCSGLKSFLFTRRHFDLDLKGRQERMNAITCDLSDKTTFFAWQRNHMANERTFLAWCRTGISLIAFGFVIERFDILIREMRIFAVNPQNAGHAHSTSIMGVIAFALGAFIVFLAGWRFFYIRRHINRGETDFSVLPDLFLMGSVLITIGAVFFFFVFFF